MSPPGRSAALFSLLLALSLRPAECGIAAASGGAAFALRNRLVTSMCEMKNEIAFASSLYVIKTQCKVVRGGRPEFST